jgi:tripartite-type tricarboxylate transporter receptor subunit TctC
MPSRRRDLLGALGAGLLAAALPLAATGPARLVIPFAAGGSTDSLARILAAELGRALIDEFEVDNRPGADGIVAAEAVRQAAPDGRTLLLATATGFSAAPAMRKGFPFDPVADFAPVSLLGTYVFFLFVHADVPARTLAELVALARSQRGRLRCGHATLTAKVAAAQLARATGLQFDNVAYAGDAALVDDAGAGRVQLFFAAAGPFLNHLRSGRLRALATQMPGRSALQPEVPTMAESGGVVTVTPWGGLFAPRGLPETVGERLHGELDRLLRQPELRQRLGALGFEAQPSTRQALAAFVAAQRQVWQQAVADAGLVG